MYVARRLESFEKTAIFGVFPIASTDFTILDPFSGMPFN
jgi:hypothetical protein